MKKQITITIHDLCYAVEALKNHVKKERYRPKEVEETYERFKRAWELIIAKDAEGVAYLIIE